MPRRWRGHAKVLGQPWKPCASMEKLGPMRGARRSLEERAATEWIRGIIQARTPMLLCLSGCDVHAPAPRREPSPRSNERPRWRVCSIPSSEIREERWKALPDGAGRKPGLPAKREGSKKGIGVRLERSSSCGNPHEYRLQRRSRQRQRGHRVIKNARHAQKKREKVLT